MSARDDDPIRQRTREGPRRLAYAEGVLLDAEDFGDEQSYHRGRLARALKYLAGHGTVAGLAVDYRAEVPDTQPEELRVAPGMAIDRVGRMIEIPRPACLRLARWWDAMVDEPDGTPNTDGRSALRQGWHDAAGPWPSGVIVEVFVRFVICERGRTPSFASGAVDAIDATAPSRLADGYELSLEVREGPPPDLPNPYQTWVDLIAAGDLPARAHLAITQSWLEGTDAWDTDTDPEPLPEHPAGVDPTGVILARVLIPADQAAAPDEAPTRRAEPVLVDNAVRHLAVTPGLFARWPAGV